jgi:hypothetical protein
MTCKISAVTFLALAGIAFLGCSCSPPSLAGAWEYKETARIKSPDSLVEAVLFTGDAGATTATTTYLYIVPVGGHVDPKKSTENKACFAADHVKNLHVDWKSARLLDVHYDEARIDHFQNIWYHRSVQEFHYVVEVRLAPNSSEFSLPAGDRNW